MIVNNTSFANIEKDLIECLKSIESVGIEVNKDQTKILDWGCPHKTESLPKGKMAIYIFIYNDICLKVGKVGPNSNPRYNSQHYNPKSSKSNLAKSILADDYFKTFDITEKNVGEWIKKNTRRINILLDENLGYFILNYIEAYFQLTYKPKYEGFKRK